MSDQEKLPRAICGKVKCSRCGRSLFVRGNPL